jgi:hypothetical protein
MHTNLIRWKGPRYANFATFSARLISFDNTWPRDGQPTPEVLCTAGFFVGNYLYRLHAVEEHRFSFFFYVHITTAYRSVEKT